jgi:hypothetical protein
MTTESGTKPIQYAKVFPFNVGLSKMSVSSFGLTLIIPYTPHRPRSLTRWANGFTVRRCTYIAIQLISSVHAIHNPLAFFVTLGLGHEEASDLHMKYFTEYGLAVRGLTLHHDIGNVLFKTVTQ